MKRVAKLIFISFLFKKLIGLAFFIHGSYIAAKRWELLQFWEDVAIINDVWLNVIGKYSIPQAVSNNNEFGNRLMTISAAMYLSKLNSFGLWCGNRVEKLDPGHFKKAYKNHTNLIITEYKKLKP